MLILVEVSLSIITTKNTLFDNLAQVFDLLITFEFTNTLRSMLKEFSTDLTEKQIDDIIVEEELDQNMKKLHCPQYLVVLLVTYR